MIACHRVALSAVIAVALITGTLVRSEAAPPPKPKAPAAKSVKVKTDTRVYLLRGLLNVFSLGMDTLQERLTAMGIEAEVFNHNGWISIANKIEEDRARGHQGAVVLIGHSLGADVLFQLAERLDKERIPVRLAVFFDPTISHNISANVEHVLNLYQLNGFGRKVTAPKGYKGELVNMDLSDDASIGHGSIDKSPKLHDLVVAKIMKVAVGPVQRKPPLPTRPKPVAVAPRPAPGAENSAKPVAVEPSARSAPQAPTVARRDAATEISGVASAGASVQNVTAKGETASNPLDPVPGKAATPPAVVLPEVPRI